MANDDLHDKNALGGDTSLLSLLESISVPVEERLSTYDYLDLLEGPNEDFFLDSEQDSSLNQNANNSSYSGLPLKTVLLHKEIVKRVNDVILFPIKPFEISYSDDLCGAEALYDRRFPDVLQISRELAFLTVDGHFESKDGKILNSTPEDYFAKVIVHEYGHRVFERDYYEDLFDVYADLPLKYASREIHSVDESFAYWLNDYIVGIDSLYEETAQGYKKWLNVDTLKSFYQLFKEEEIETASVESIIKSFPGLIKANRNYIKKITLPSYEDQLFSQLELFEK